MESDYYPFGIMIAERSFNTGSYRFGFNGKEKDDEVKGAGNSLDFGARIYDSRLGTWFGIDPFYSKFPGISPYVFSFNNPILFKDPNGKDSRVTVQENSNGSGGMITIESTIHLYGVNANDFKTSAEAKFNDINKPVKFVDAQGQEWTVQYSLTFIVDKKLDKIDIDRNGTTRKELAKSTNYIPGDNAVCTDCIVPNGWLEAADFGGSQTLAPLQATVIHGVFHNLGFNDYYDETGDVMAQTSPNRIAKFHAYDAAESILTTYKNEKETGAIQNGKTTYTLLGNRFDNKKSDHKAQQDTQNSRQGSENFVGPRQEDGSY